MRGEKQYNLLDRWRRYVGDMCTSGKGSSKRSVTTMSRRVYEGSNGRCNQSSCRIHSCKERNLVETISIMYRKKKRRWFGYHRRFLVIINQRLFFCRKVLTSVASHQQKRTFASLQGYFFIDYICH